MDRGETYTVRSTVPLGACGELSEPRRGSGLRAHRSDEPGPRCPHVTRDWSGNRAWNSAPSCPAVQMTWTNSRISCLLTV